MKKFLPAFFIVILGIFVFSSSVYAQVPTATPRPSPTLTPAPAVPASVSPAASASLQDGKWVEDPEVTFVGKAGARSGAFLDWTIKSYQWVDGASNLSAFWASIRNIVYAFLILMVLIAAFILIVSRGRNLTVTQFIPRFIMVVILVTFSFALVEFIYQTTDAMQAFFLRKNDTARTFISQKDLLYIGFNYDTFKGYRLIGAQYDESAFMSLFLVKLTTITYYVMAAILVLRKIILWFFIIISPIFPLLLLYSPVRNTAKVWVGEFFRWVLYAPLFAIFLSGLVAIWKTNSIPLNFQSTGTAALYPTAINILLGGPGQVIGFDKSVSRPETFALYIVALIMLWVVMLLPFLLLQIFLDYLRSISFKDNAAIRQAMNMSTALLNRASVPTPAPIGPAPSPVSTGAARALPFARSEQNIARATINTQATQNISRSNFNESMVSSSYQRMQQQTLPILRLASLSVPTLTDIAHYETKREETTRVNTVLQKIANPTTSMPLERSRFMQVRDQLSQEKQKGNPVAQAVLQASSTMSAITSNAPQVSPVAFPAVNRVQQVSFEDYEAVKKLWKENYQKLEPPRLASGSPKDRSEWVKEDIAQINNAINLLSSSDPVKVKEGMSMVGHILPFLLIGGFSQTEVLAYLKAKLEAAKAVTEEEAKKQDEESTMIAKEDTAPAKPAEQHMQAEAVVEAPTPEVHSHE